VEQLGGPFNTSSLGVASEYGHYEVVELLLLHNADIGSVDDRGLNPLHLAVCGGHINTAEVLLVSGADVNARIRPCVGDVADGLHMDELSV
jgi:ankyrin repeat protein